MNDTWSTGVILFAMVTGELPWTKRNQSDLFAQIRRGEYRIPSYLSRLCTDLIKRLLTVDTAARITVQDAMRHPWFDGIALQQTPVGALRRVSLRQCEECFEPRAQALPMPMRRTKSSLPMDIEKTITLLVRPTVPPQNAVQVTGDAKQKRLPALPKRGLAFGVKRSNRLARPVSRLGTAGGILKW
jgi:serine/threonine protein kinase